MLRISPIRYSYAVETPERGVAVVMPDAEAVAEGIVVDILNGGRPTYLARYLPGLESQYRLSAPGPLVEVKRGGPGVPAPAIAQQVTLPSGVTLLGLTPRSTDVPAGESWRGTLYWRAEQKLSDSYYVHLRLSDGNGAVAYLAKPAVPVQGLPRHRSRDHIQDAFVSNRISRLEHLSTRIPRPWRYRVRCASFASPSTVRCCPPSASKQSP